MREAYEDASSAFERGDHGDARSYADRGKELKAELPGLVSDRRAMIEEIQGVRSRHQAYLDVYRDKKREWQLAKERFDDHKAMRQAAKQDAAFRAGVQHHGDDVKVVHKDGKSHVYFGGVGEPDGEGHAHYVLDEFGNIEYRRDPFADRGPQNFR